MQMEINGVILFTPRLISKTAGAIALGLPPLSRIDLLILKK